jgi:hypothetical protein
MRTTLFSLIIASAVSWAATTQAQTNASSPPTLSSAPAAPGVHRHDGFYLRLATGFGAYNESIRQKGADDATAVTGIASVGEFALGGAIRPGVIFGGGVFSCGVLASDRTVRGPVPPSEIVDSQGSLTIVGPFMDYYFDAHRGLHFQGAIGFASLRGVSVGSGEVDKDRVALGGGMMVGFGYEWWVSDQWSLGILGRITGGFATGKDASDVRWNHAVGASPSVLFTGTYN